MRFPYQHYEIPASPVNGSTDLYRPEIPLGNYCFGFGIPNRSLHSRK